MALLPMDRRVCYLARKLNNATTDRARAKWEKEASGILSIVNAIRPHIARFDKEYCFAKSDALAVEAFMNERN